ncbi:MAG: sigma-70 family RNA polymerase sigma factor [Planctomycetota bacterium]
MANETQLSMLARVQQTTVGQSWNEFAELYDGMIHGWLARQGVQSQDADDIRQEVMTVVLRRIGGFEHNGREGAFRAWLKMITSNCLRDFWKKKSRRGGGGPDLGEMAAQLEDESSNLSSRWDAEHDRYVLNHLLDQISERLSEKSVQIFRRVAVEQESAESVANDLGMKLGAVRVAQHRVLNALKEAGEGLIDY